MRRPPPHVQRGVRLALAVFIACLIGYGVVLPRGTSIHDHYERQWVQSFKWCAITCVVVSAPVIGKVSQVGIERVLGTIIGGLTGYAVYILGSLVWNTTTDGIILSVGAAAVAYISCEAAQRLKLADSAKLFALTFLLVTFGAHDGISALQVMISRISGICIGVGLSLLISVIIYPSSATVKALACMRQSLTGLVELNAMAWQEPAIYQLPGDIASKMSSGSNPWGYMALSDKDEADGWSSNAKKRQEHFEAETERILMDTYNSLYKCQEFVPQAKSEIYMGVLKKHLCFLPGLPFGCQLGRWTLPQTEMQTLATCVRRLARLLWTLHLTFQEGFDENMMAMLKQQYPSRLMPQLVQSAQATLQDMLDAFPNEDRVNSSNMRQFATAVAGLLHISDFQRRRITHMMRHYRDMRRKRSSQLATSVVHQFKQNAANAHASRLSEPSGMPPSYHSSSDSLPDSPNSTASAPQLGQDHSEKDCEAGNHVVVDMPDGKLSQVEPPHPRQHVTMPTGVAETAFAEDPEAEEAAVALQNDSFLHASAAKANGTSEIEGDSPPLGKENGPRQVATKRRQPSSTATAAASQPNFAAGLGRSQSTNIRDPKRSKHQGLAALLDSPELPPGRAGPYALRRDLRAGKPSAISHREPSLAHLAASNLADHSVNHAVAAARQQQSQHQSPAKASSSKSDGFGASEQQDRAVGDHRRQDSFSGFAPSSAGNASQMSTPFSQPLSMDPLDAFAHLPEGLRIQLQNPGSEDMSRANSLVYNHGDEQSGMSISLPRVNSSELLLFPETAEGHVSKVRWYSFQFLMEELAEEFQEMHVALTALLIKLPDGVIKLT